MKGRRKGGGRRRAGDGIALKWTKRTAERGREDGRAVSKLDLDAMDKEKTEIFAGFKKM